MAATALAEGEYARGLITIGAITFMFASNSPVVHAAFTMTQHPPPVLLLNCAVALVGLGGLVMGSPLLRDMPKPSTLREASGADAKRLMLQAGAELGCWKFLGTTANLYGLSLTSAGHGAFLIQLTTLLVPAAQGLMGVPIPRRIWGAIGLALAGVLAFTLDPEGAARSSWEGDALCVLAAGLYATYDLRLFHWGRRVAPLGLISTKVCAQAALSLALLMSVGGEDALAFADAVAPDDVPLLASVVLWSGLVVNAIAPFLQVGGQQATGPARAQVIYASQPLWAALMSLLVLGETVGVQGVVGGAAFLVACFLAATAPEPDANCGQGVCEI